MITLTDTWRVRVGASHEEWEARKVYLYDKGTTRATNGLLEIIHDLNENVEVFASVAKKTRLPTLKDRYSARLGRALPNPDLKPEVARHAELGLRGKPWTDAYGEATVATVKLKVPQTAIQPCLASQWPALNQPIRSKTA